jgi:hypothetical protein
MESTDVIERLTREGGMDRRLQTGAVEAGLRIAPVPVPGRHQR